MPTQEIPRLEGLSRARLGSRFAARLRKEARLPAVIYGHGQEPVHLSFDAREVTDLLRRNAHVVQVACDGHDEPCLIKDVQWDHLGTQVLHVDLARVDLTERVRTAVALALFGEPVGLKHAGAVLQRHVDTIDIECLAADIPQSIRTDISSLDVGRAWTVADLRLPEGVACPLPPDTTLASISVVVTKEEEAPVPEAAEAEPEVITARKEEPKEE